MFGTDEWQQKPHPVTDSCIAGAAGAARNSEVAWVFVGPRRSWAQFFFKPKDTVVSRVIPGTPTNGTPYGKLPIPFPYL